MSLQIPYHPQLALTEEPHIFRRRRGYLFEAYRAIERGMLVALGHDAWTLLHKIADTLQKKDYLMSLHNLRHAVRLDNGKFVLNGLSFDLVMGERRFLGSEAIGKLNLEQITLNDILGDVAGRQVIEFILEHLPLEEEEWGYSAFLLQRLTIDSVDLADKFYRRIVAAKPNDVATLRNYGVFLVEQRGDLDNAENYFKQALETDPKDANNLRDYALFLMRYRNNLDDAEEYFKRALEADQKNTSNIGNYASFLAQYRYDFGKADEYFKHALEIDPKDANNLGNYGQFLVGLSQLSEGKQFLVSAYEHLGRASMRNRAKIFFSLWLISRMQERAAEHWERFFKFLIQKGFKRHPWSFERMLDQAKKILSPEEFEYAEALARAFLDESQVSNLARYERWRTLEPLDPMEAGNKYSEHIAASIPSASS